jgi:hypothetical protein
MVIELIKEFDNAGQISYYIKVDDKFQSGTVRSNVMDAMDIYENIKANYTKARVEVLVKEII